MTSQTSAAASPPPAEFYRAPSAWNNIELSGCVIRFDELSDTGKSVVPRIHANETHMDVGVTKVYVDWGTPDKPGTKDLIIECADGGIIIAVAVLPDETMTRMGITCGPSGGGVKTRVPLYLNGARIPAYDLRLYGKNANLWCLFARWGGDESPVQQAFVDLLARVTALETWQREHSS